MKKISNWLLSISSTWLMVGTLVIMLGFMIFVLPPQADAASQMSGEAGSPDLSFFYSPEDLYQMAENYSLSARQAYIRARWSFDLIFPMVYVSFLSVGISWFANRLTWTGTVWKLGNTLPLLGGIFDLLENTGASMTMASYPDRSIFLLWMASISTPIKWALVCSSFLLYFILGARHLSQKLRS